MCGTLAPPRKFCDSGWRPVSSLDDGLRETLEGFRQRARGASASIGLLEGILVTASLRGAALHRLEQRLQLDRCETRRHIAHGVWNHNSLWIIPHTNTLRLEHNPNSPPPSELEGLIRLADNFRRIVQIQQRGPNAILSHRPHPMC